tara:strand:- start:461 stop:592 length:132 start_codon:yes stop_codon:yes gene_type:complete
MAANYRSPVITSDILGFVRQKFIGGSLMTDCHLLKLMYFLEKK